MEVPSLRETLFPAGWTRSAPTLWKAMPRLRNTGGRATSIAFRVRQWTATQGLEGTKWNRSLSEMTVT